MGDRNRVRAVVGRALVAAVVGALVAGVAYVCAFLTQRGDGYYLSRWEAVRLKLDVLETAIDKHRQATGRLPGELAELNDERTRNSFDADGRMVDAWNHPYQYRVEGDTFTLYSLGQDGLPGGEGLDADIYPSSAGRPLDLPTLRQFTFDLDTENVQWTCFLAGACAALVFLLPSRNRRGIDFVARVGATAVGAVVIAVFISALHIPSGH